LADDLDDRFFSTPYLVEVASSTPFESCQIRTQMTQKQGLAQIDFPLICVDLRSICAICVNCAAGWCWKTNGFRKRK